MRSFEYLNSHDFKFRSVEKLEIRDFRLKSHEEIVSKKEISFLAT